MPYTKTILCLANSWKRGGSCVAGKEFDGTACGAWLRPVSARPNEELSDREMRLGHGGMPEPLDIVDVPLLAPRPHTYQSENHLIDPDRRWALRRRASWAEALAAVDRLPGILWINGRSTRHGKNDEMREEAVRELPGSLALIGPVRVAITIARESGEDGGLKLRARAAFEWSRYTYRLSVTDPWLRERFPWREDAALEIPEALLCLSVSEIFERRQCAYKLVAAVIPAERA